MNGNEAWLVFLVPHILKLCSDSRGTRFCGMFLKLLKKLAARVLSGLKTRGVAMPRAFKLF